MQPGVLDGDRRPTAELLGQREVLVVRRRRDSAVTRVITPRIRVGTRIGTIATERISSARSNSSCSSPRALLPELSRCPEELGDTRVQHPVSARAGRAGRARAAQSRDQLWRGSRWAVTTFSRRRCSSTRSTMHQSASAGTASARRCGASAGSRARRPATAPTRPAPRPQFGHLDRGDVLDHRHRRDQLAVGVAQRRRLQQPPADLAGRRSTACSSSGRPALAAT